jgi:hypothetical protein
MENLALKIDMTKTTCTLLLYDYLCPEQRCLTKIMFHVQEEDVESSEAAKIAAFIFHKS